MCLNGVKQIYCCGRGSYNILVQWYMAVIRLHMLRTPHTALSVQYRLVVCVLRQPQLGVEVGCSVLSASGLSDKQALLQGLSRLACWLPVFYRHMALSARGQQRLRSGIFSPIMCCGLGCLLFRLFHFPVDSVLCGGVIAAGTQIRLVVLCATMPV